MNRSYFATEDDFSFFGNGTLSKLLIGFDCLFEGNWNGIKTKPYADTVEVFKELRKLGYSLFLCEVPEKGEILTWLDETFDYGFTCNDYPTRYADLSDHWTEIKRNIPMSLCTEGNKNHNRDICFSGNWTEILELIKENDILARTERASIIYEDMNEKSTALLKQIAIPETEHPVSYGFKPAKEKWEAEILKWNVKEEITAKYDVRLVIEQGSLCNRGSWIKITAKAVDGEWQKLWKILNQFCKDYGFDKKKELSFITPYELPSVSQ